ncbi:Hypothetical predicted protein [Pelobates cultripes]|uniref:Uncharacterized protein n=1 Tax=Pelobates cultripes TaxID=61616 RepID=A0AAD1RCE3_PELCU|nr:Hypothetical predicted protein [Pelobates cultripes]
MRGPHSRMRGPHSRIAAAVLTEGNFAALFARGPRHSDREGRELIGASGHNPGSAPPISTDSKPMVPSGRKATCKSHHLSGATSRTSKTDRLRPVEIDDVVLPRKRAPAGQKRCGLGRGQKPYLIRPTPTRTQRRYQMGPMTSTQLIQTIRPPNAATPRLQL